MYFRHHLSTFHSFLKKKIFEGILFLHSNADNKDMENNRVCVVFQATRHLIPHSPLCLDIFSRSSCSFPRSCSRSWLPHTLKNFSSSLANCCSFLRSSEAMWLLFCSLDARSLLRKMENKTQDHISQCYRKIILNHLLFVGHVLYCRWVLLTWVWRVCPGYCWFP